jgi:hypothetical protein
MVNPARKHVAAAKSSCNAPWNCSRCFRRANRASSRTGPLLACNNFYYDLYTVDDNSSGDSSIGPVRLRRLLDLESVCLLSPFVEWMTVLAAGCFLFLDPLFTELDSPVLEKEIGKRNSTSCCSRVGCARRRTDNPHTPECAGLAECHQKTGRGPFPESDVFQIRVELLAVRAAPAEAVATLQVAACSSGTS